MFHQGQDDFLIITDTLSTTPSPSLEPHLFVTKTFPVPPMNMALVGTGAANLVAEWKARLHSGMLARDVTTLDLHTPDALRGIMADLIAQFGPIDGTSTIYHFGIDEQTGRAVRFAYRSTADFTSERVDEPGFAMKPPPVNGYSEDDDTNTLKGLLALAIKVRAEQDLLPGYVRVAIGGDLIATHVTSGNVAIQRLYRFPDYEEMWLAMSERLRLTAPGE